MSGKNDLMREAFERQCVGAAKAPRCTGPFSDEYDDSEIQDRWELWQAATQSALEAAAKVADICPIPKSLSAGEQAGFDLARMTIEQAIRALMPNNNQGSK